MSLLRRLVSGKVLLALAAVGLLLAVGGLAWLTGLVSFRSVDAGLLEARPDPGATVDLTNLTALNQDTDRDGIPDLLENYRYGTDPLRWDSRGDGVPDGWLVEHGYDPLTTNATVTLAARPPVEDTPSVYGSRGLPDLYLLTLAESYAFKRPLDWSEEERGPWQGGLDPRKWDSTGSGIPDGWLVRNGLDPLTPRIQDLVLPGDDLPVGEKYRTGTIPGVRDSDQDGLSDEAERTQHGTDPAKLSTSGSGIPDGWLVAFNLDPLDPDAAHEDPDRDGLTNVEEFQWSFDTLGPDALQGAGLRPLEWDSGGTRIPDGWLVKYRLNPLDPSVGDTVVQRASDYEQVRDLDTVPDLSLAVRDAYRYERPATWSEPRDGVWWGGTNPTVPDTDGDGIPDAVELRGWRVNVTYDVGPRAKSEAIRVESSPVSTDTDGDGLTDAEEYGGTATRGEGAAAVTVTFPPTDPGNRDTAFSGLTDNEKLFGFTLDGVPYVAAYTLDGERRGLDPTKADSPGRYVKDGPAFQYWITRSASLATEREYPFESLVKSTGEFAAKLPGATGGSGVAALQALLGPLGDLDGDKVPNAFDADSDDDGLQDGLETTPEFYSRTDFRQTRPRDPTDPANPDTDGDTLGDGWEVRSATADREPFLWNLNPARWSSLRDGVDDRHRNLDGDRFQWVSYEGTPGSLVRVSHFVDYNASRHYQYYRETGVYVDPTVHSTAGDGVSDGWKAFWTRTYPSLVLSGRPEAGILVPTRAQLEASALAGATATTPLGDARLAENTYTRFNRTATAAPPPIGPGETREERYVLDGGASVWRITGKARLTLRDAYNLSRTPTFNDAVDALNPYLADTDGDEMPDHWEVHYRSTEGPRPTVPDGNGDADTDGLVNRDEWKTGNTRERRYGSDPTASDTDLGSAADFSEFVAGAITALLDPTNDQALLRADPDTDGDGVRNLLELQGWGGPDGAREGLFPKGVRTNLTNPDTDGDGLLDGKVGDCTAPADTSACAPLSPESDLARALLALGIAHETRNGKLVFLGEVGSLPRNAVTSPVEAITHRDGIPDGWRTYYGLDGPQDALATTHYAAFKPAWWDEDVHGVWWWGLPATLAAADGLDGADLDADGLNDRNGEDPFPAANHENLALGERDPAKAVEALLALDGDALRAAAQKWGDGAGDPTGARAYLAECPVAASGGLVCDGDLDGISDRDERAPTLLKDVKIGPTAAGSARIALSKATPVTVTGRLVLASDGATPVRNATVLASLYSSANRTRLGGDAMDAVVGAGFTDAQGRFSFQVSLLPDHTLTLPAAGLILNGTTSGAVAWQTAPDLVAIGNRTSVGGATVNNELALWAYNTSATLTTGPHAHYNFTQPKAGGGVSHLNAVQGPPEVLIPLQVTSPARILAEDVPDRLSKGDGLSGTLRLVDAAGAPLRERSLALRWTGVTGSAVTAEGQVNRDGIVDLSTVTPRLLATPSAPGKYNLEATYAGASAEGIGAAAPLRIPITVRFPTVVTAKGPTEPIPVGEVVTITGRLTQAGIAYVGEISGSLGGSRSNVTSRADGTFTVSLLAPLTLPGGRQAATVTFPGDAGFEEASVPVNLTIQGRTRLLDLPERTATQGEEVEFRGKLVDNAGAAVAGARIDVSVGGNYLRSVTTLDDGTFRTPIDLSRAPGPVQVEARFPGTPERAGTVNATTFLVTAPATVTLEPYAKPVPRAGSIGVRGRLVDALGKPIPAQGVTLFLEGATNVAKTVLTRDDGRFEDSLFIPGSLPLGATRVVARYNGSADGVIGPGSAETRLVVQARTDLTVNFLRALVGENPITGRLIDDRQNPVVGARLSITFGTLATTAITDATGAYAATLHVPLHEPVGTRNVTAVYDGNERYAPARSVNFGGLVGRTGLTAEAPALAVRGTNITVTGTTFSEDGKPLDGDVKIYVADRRLTEGKSVDGTYNLTTKVLTTVPVGNQTLRVEFSPRGFYGGSEISRPLLVKAKATLETTLPKTVTAGAPFEARVKLKDDNNKALQDAVVLFSIDGGEPVTVRTNAKGEATLVATAPAGIEAPRLTVRYRGTGLVAGTPTEAFVLTATPAPIPEGFPLALTLAGVAVLLVAGAVFGVLWYRRRHLREVKRLLDLGIARLNAGNEYEATIYLTYQALAKALARFGLLHEASDTPGDLGRAFKRLLPETDAPVDAFIRVFEEARYSERQAGRRERDLAIQSFRAIQASIDKALKGSPSLSTPSDRRS